MPASADDTASALRIRRRFLAVLALRWASVGFLVPVMVLFMVQRGLSLPGVGVAIGVYGATVALLELPTGGLADTWGRKPTLAVASAASLAGLGMFLAADSLAAFAAAWGVMGVGRALDSGALEAWFVDATRAIIPDADLHDGLSKAGAVGGAALAAGALAAGLLPGVLGRPGAGAELAVPLATAAVVGGAHLAAVLLLIEEGHREGRRGLLSSLGTVPATVGAGLRLAYRGPVVGRLIATMLAAGVTLNAVEVLWQPRFADLLGGVEGNTAAFGLVAAAGFGAAAVGSAVGPRLLRRRDKAAAAGSAHLAVAGALGLLGASGGFGWALACYVGVYLAVGFVGPIHNDLLHAEVGPEQRSTLLSLDSLAVQTGGLAGTLTVPSIAEAAGIPAAWWTAAVVMAASSLLYYGIRRRRAPAGNAG